MKTHHCNNLLLFSFLLLGPVRLSLAACDQTLSPGANVASAISSAPNGSTICLNNGNYGSVNFSGISKSNYVTVQSTSGRGATISPQIGDSDFLRFTNLTISGSGINNCSSNIQLTNSTFTSGLLINMRGYTCAYPLNILIDGSIFSNLGPAVYEGRISVADDDGKQASMGVTISNNQIRDGCLSDGIQLAGGASGVQIGPGNDFNNIIQSGPTHCDMIQFYGSGQNNTITGNWFRNGSVALTHHTSAPSGTVFKNNIVSNVNQIQVGSSSGFTFEHNTIHNLTDLFRFNAVSDSSGVIFRNNIISGSSQSAGGLTGATVSHQLCATSGQCSGTNQIIGTPTFTGGSSPATWAGYQLTSSSLGYQAASDGKDRGANSFGPTTTPPVAPAAPTNLRVN